MSWILSVDIGGTSFKAMAMQTTNHPSGPQVQRTKLYSETTQSSNPEDVLGAILKLHDELALEFGSKCAGIAGGFPGIVNSESLIVGSPNLPSWQNINLKSWFESRAQVASTWTNDANLAAYAEIKTPAGLRANNLVMLTLGTGVGAGIILNRTIYSGAGFAGEAGHITVDPMGVPCGCGRVGCLETVFSKLGFENAMEKSLGQVLAGGVPELFAAAQDSAHSSHEQALDIMNIAFDQFAMGISSIITLIDPDLLVLAGGLTQSGDFILKELETHLARRVRYPGYKLPQLVISEFGNLAGVEGGLALATDTFLGLND